MNNKAKLVTQRIKRFNRVFFGCVCNSNTFSMCIQQMKQANKLKVMQQNKKCVKKI